jgi:predicted transcriptional regulator
MQQTTKQEAINAISSLPDTASIEDIMYRLYVIEKIKRGMEAADNGKTVTLEELKREAATW